MLDNQEFTVQFSVKHLHFPTETVRTCWCVHLFYTFVVNLCNMTITLHTHFHLKYNCIHNKIALKLSCTTYFSHIWSSSGNCSLVNIAKLLVCKLKIFQCYSIFVIHKLKTSAWDLHCDYFHYFLFGASMFCAALMSIVLWSSFAPSWTSGMILLAFLKLLCTFLFVPVCSHWLKNAVTFVLSWMLCTSFVW
jgi:hypothetical protein